jgi:predicted dehydrogenase
VACADVDLDRAQRLADRWPGAFASSTDDLVNRPDLDVVVVATPNALLQPIALQAVRAGKHVLVEKPAATSAADLSVLREAAARQGVLAKVGYNHRFHPALKKAHCLFAEGAAGDLLYVRARYGHGGRQGYEREWRANPRLSGGGELLDQGSHLIDLARWFAGDFADVSGHIGTYFWDMPVEDNAFMCLKTSHGQVAWLHASWTDWRNLFSFEVFGRTGKLQVDGLGGSYGIERLTFYRMLPELGPPEVTSWEYLEPDTSWHAEMDHFADAINGDTPLMGGLDDALAVLEIVQRLYSAGHA